MPSTAEGSRRHRSVERRVSCEVLEKKWDFSSRTLDGGIKVKAKKGSKAGTEESLGLDGSPADLSMATPCKSTGRQVESMPRNNPGSKPNRPCLAGLCRPIDQQVFQVHSQERGLSSPAGIRPTHQRTAIAEVPGKRYRLTVRTGHHRARSPDQRHQAITHRVLIRNVVGKIPCHESFLINEPPDERGSKRNDNQHAPP